MTAHIEAPPPPQIQHLLGCKADRGGTCGCGAEAYARRVAILTLEEQMPEDVKWLTPSGQEVAPNVCGTDDVQEGPESTHTPGPVAPEEVRLSRLRSVAVEALARFEHGDFCPRPDCVASMRNLAVAALSGYDPLPRCQGHPAATPRPWRLGIGYGSIVADAPEGATCDPDHRYCGPKDYGGHLIAESIRASNSELIVRAVNAHDDLVLALSETCEALRQTSQHLQEGVRESSGSWEEPPTPVDDWSVEAVTHVVANRLVIEAAAASIAAAKARS